MNFKEWHKENGEYSWIDPATVEAEKAWDYQQEKLDKIKAIMDQDVYHIPTLIKEIKEILK